MKEPGYREPAPSRLIEMIREAVRQPTTPELEIEAVNLCRQVWNLGDQEIQGLLANSLVIYDPSFNRSLEYNEAHYPSLAVAQLRAAELARLRATVAMTILSYRNV